MIRARFIHALTFLFHYPDYFLHEAIKRHLIAQRANTNSSSGIVITWLLPLSVYFILFTPPHHRLCLINSIHGENTAFQPENYFSLLRHFINTFY